MQEYLKKVQLPGETTATIKINIRYLKGCTSGDITATASLVKKGGRVITLQAEITNTDNQSIAQAGATFMVLGKKIS